MVEYKVKFGELKAEKTFEGVKSKGYKHDDKQLRVVEYSKKMPPHWCEKGHYGYMLEGSWEIEYQNEKVVYQPGDGVFIPDGKEHRHRAKVLSEFVKVVFVENV